MLSERLIEGEAFEKVIAIKVGAEVMHKCLERVPEGALT